MKEDIDKKKKLNKMLLKQIKKLKDEEKKNKSSLKLWGKLDKKATDNSHNLLCSPIKKMAENRLHKSQLGSDRLNNDYLRNLEPKLEFRQAQ